MTLVTTIRQTWPNMEFEIYPSLSAEFNSGTTVLDLYLPSQNGYQQSRKARNAFNLHVCEGKRRRGNRDSN